MSDRRMTTAWAVLIVSVVALCGVVIWWLDATRFEPLGDYPTQIVESRVEGVEGPAVRMGESVIVTATKCIAADEPVAIRGEYHWARVSGARLTLPGSAGVTTRQPGCTTLVFENPLPPGITPGTWVIEGAETATQGARTHRRAWTTEPFEVLP